jgi:hypothetical protein
VNSLFFWIIVLSFVVPTARRLYRQSVRRRSQDQGMPGRFPDQLGGGYPGQYPGAYPGQNKQPRDGYTQQDYFGGGFGQAGGPGRPAPPDQQGYGTAYPNSPYPDQQYPGQQGHGAPVAYEDSPGYLNNPPLSGQHPAGHQPAGPPPAPAVPPPPSGPQGYRARKLAELDQRYSNGELAMEDYMAQRAEIMKG